MAVAAAVAIRLPFLAEPLSADEGGFLMVAGQWRPGDSLYGDYWVDRPPLLFVLFGMAEAAGGMVPLRVLGAVAAATSVAMAATLARLVAPASTAAPAVAAVGAAAFLSTPLFGSLLVNGELLALPFVLGGLIAILRGMSGGHAVWWALAGVAGTCAVFVKQNFFDVFAAGLAACAVLYVEGRRAAAWRAGALGAVAALLTAAALLVFAASRGTVPLELWDAVVTFRLEAIDLISDKDPSPVINRGLLMIAAFAVSGAVILIGVAAFSRTEPDAGHGPPAAPIAVAVLAWEVVAIVLGGNFWPHYLVGIVPGVVFVAALACRRGRLPTRRAEVGVAYSVLATALALAMAGPSNGTTKYEVAAGDYLAEQAQPGDTGVVAFGQPQILHRAGMHSAYPHLWSMPVKVNDPKLAEFSELLSGPGRPAWVVVSGKDLDTWGVDTTTARVVLERDYSRVTTIGKWTIYRVNAKLVAHRQPSSGAT